jgi:ATP-dependent helicase HrpB
MNGSSRDSGQGRLPIYELEGEIRSAVCAAGRLIVQAPTGSGKSTQVPQMLLDGGLCPEGQIVVLQPRRLAARMLARRVAFERNCALGGEVGYQVRLDNRSGPATRIKYETDGVLLRQLLTDSALRSVAAILFDEFHERHLNTDVMLGRALQLQNSIRPDLKLIVMSATLDLAPLRVFLGDCPALCASGRAYPVTVQYLERAAAVAERSVWELAATEFERMAAPEDGAHVLVFMPGAYEIRRTIEEIRRTRAGKAYTVLPLHGELPASEQDAAFAAGARPKAIVATNVAETSITIDGVGLVIDSGLVRRARFDPFRGINTLMIEKISRASAEQRTGRAGRTGPGRCVRLWTEADHGQRAAQDPPEIARVDLSEAVLLLKAGGVEDVARFPWPDPPDSRSLSRAFGLLVDLGAMEAADGRVTDTARRMLAFPVHPRYARMMVEASDRGCLGEIALIAALAQERSILVARQNQDVVEKREDLFGGDTVSDLVVLARAWRYAAARDFDVEACSAVGVHAQGARRVGDVFRQFLAVAGEKRDGEEHAAVRPAVLAQCVLSGFSDQLARRVSAENQRYELVHGRRGTLEKESVARKCRLLVASEVREIGSGRGEADVRLSLATGVEPEWLREEFPGDLSERRIVRFDAGTRQVHAEVQTWFRDLLIDTARSAAPTAGERAAALAAEVQAGRLTLKQWDHRVAQWILRVNRLAEWWPELGVTRITRDDERSIIEQVCLDAKGYKEVRDRPVWPVVYGWLSPAQREAVERHAPERVTLSNGRSPKVTYEPANPPFIAMRIQELYDVSDPVSIAGGRVRVAVRILAPNGCPVQITDDLSSFWREGYERAKKELRGRYPKHEWR